jgi:hypothetical protein
MGAMDYEFLTMGQIFRGWAGVFTVIAMALAIYAGVRLSGE